MVAHRQRRFVYERVQCQRERQCEQQQRIEHEHPPAALIPFQPDLVGESRTQRINGRKPHRPPVICRENMRPVAQGERCLHGGKPFHALGLSTNRAHPMNSEDRRKARRARREAQREAKRKERNRDITLENMASMNTLYKAHKEARRGISWKNACQRYEIHWLTNIVRQHDGLMAGGEIGCRSRHIRIYERGKPRG